MLGVMRILSWSVGVRWIGNKERVLLISGRMLLGYEEGVKVPETSFDVPARRSVKMPEGTDTAIPIGRHLFEAHLEEYLPKFVSNFVYCNVLSAEANLSHS